MDTLTTMIAGMENPIITLIAELIHNGFLFVFLVLLLVLLIEKNNDKRKKILFALVLALTIGTIIKEIGMVERPCVLTESKIQCPDEYSMPSLHALISFVLMISFLDDKKFIYFLIFGLFVAFTRIYLGIHSFEDVAASLALSAVIYGLVDYYWKGWKL